MNIFVWIVFILCVCAVVSMWVGHFIYKADPENRVKSDKDILIEALTR